MKVFVQMILVASFVYSVFVSPTLAAEDVNIATLQKVLQGIAPEIKPDVIRKSVMPGVYEAVFGTKVLYLSSDGKYMIQGDLIDLQRRVNLTEEGRQGARMEIIKSLDASFFVTFSPQKKKADYIVTVFTDIDCGYCRKFHAQIKEYNKLGIEVRYASFPRSGPKTSSYFKAEAVWCAEDRKEAMTIAKNGASLEQLQKITQRKDFEACKSAVEKQYNAVRDVGISGTPTLFMENGKMIPGYVSPERLIKVLETPSKS